MDRRTFLIGAAGLAAAAPFIPGAAAMGIFGKKNENTEGKVFPFQLSEAEWRKRLTEQQFHVLRDHGTERAFSSPLNDEKRNGTFLCAGCDNPLFSSEHKFDSGTGWPSFWQPVGAGAVGTSEDSKFFMTRTEVHCANCGGHLGHVFDDGPKPTGLRYCMNGVAMKFQPAQG